MDKPGFNQDLLQFLQHSPTPFHAVANMAAALDAAGFEALDEKASWALKPASAYYVIRNRASLIAFRTGSDDLATSGLRLLGTHTDSPCLKVEPLPEKTSNGYLQLGAEVYGGVLLAPWFDRDLSLAGRVDFVTDSGELQSALIDVQAPIATIPSLAIHLFRTVHEERTINPQNELVPVLLQLDQDEEFSFNAWMLEQVRLTREGKAAAKVLAHELSFYDVQAPALIGLRQQFIASARLDNLLSCFCACRAIVDSAPDRPALMVCNDHEEVGSMSASGAQGPFLKGVLERVLGHREGSDEAMRRMIANSRMLSVDNAHGVHPNYVDKHDDKHRPLLNRGPVIKINANQRYASNSESIAAFKQLCDAQDIPYQSFVMRSDMACGSTIGPITAAELGVNTVDIGVATFGMHSIRELGGADDPLLLTRALAAFLQS